MSSIISVNTLCNQPKIKSFDDLTKKATERKRKERKRENQRKTKEKPREKRKEKREKGRGAFRQQGRYFSWVGFQILEVNLIKTSVLWIFCFKIPPYPFSEASVSAIFSTSGLGMARIGDGETGNFFDSGFYLLNCFSALLTPIWGVFL